MDQNTLNTINVYIYEKVFSKSLQTFSVCTCCYILNQLKDVRFFYKRNEVSLLAKKVVKDIFRSTVEPQSYGLHSYGKLGQPDTEIK